MFYKILGWLSILLVAFSLVPSLVPGAMSVIGFLISFFALVVSIVSIKSGDDIYFKTTIITFGVGIFFVNDGLRLFYSLPQISWWYKIIAYGLFVVTCILYMYIHKKYGLKERN